MTRTTSHTVAAPPQGSRLGVIEETPDFVGSLRTALADRYVIEREIGRGGMALVYLATDLRGDRQVAIKVLRPEYAATLHADRFLQEIRFVTELDHPGILPAYESGVAAGIYFYVMRYVPGETLRKRLIREGQLSIEEAVRLAREIASALAHAHSQGIVHRDIKPENILLSDGHTVIADFGIARAVSEAGGDRLTTSGLIVGTPEYMSPEQGSAGGVVDERSDVYSFGCVVYEMLAGEPPFTGRSSRMVISRQIGELPRSLRVIRDAIPAHIEMAIRKALAKAPADRFADPREFANTLVGASLRGNAPVSARLALIGALCISSMAGDCPPPPPPQYDVARIEANPSSVHVLAGKSVLIRARLFDSYQRLIEPSVGYDVEWVSDDDERVAVAEIIGHDAVIKALATSDATPPPPVRLRATVMDLEDWVFVMVIPRTTVASGELIFAKHVDGDPPEVVVADGTEGTVYVQDKTLAFAGAGLLPDLVAGGSSDSGEVAVFSSRQAAGYFRFPPPAGSNWTTGDGLIKLSNEAATFAPRDHIVDQPLGDALVVPLRFWNAAASDLSYGELLQKLDAINLIFSANRSGLRFTLHSFRLLDITAAASDVCATLDTHFPAVTQTEAGQAVANVFLVTEMEPGMGAGIQCGGSPQIDGIRVAGPVMVVGATGQDDVLAHELGHALTLTLPSASLGHINGMTGFDASNVMLAGGILRDHFSVGQVFRMALDSLSWAFRAGTIGRVCGTAQTVEVPVTDQWPCPRLNNPP